MPDTAGILVNVYDGTRQPLPAVHWIGRVSDGRPPSERKTWHRCWVLCVRARAESFEAARQSLGRKHSRRRVRAVDFSQWK